MYCNALEDNGSESSKPPDDSIAISDDSGSSGVEEVDGAPTPGTTEKDAPGREEKRK